MAIAGFTLTDSDTGEAVVFAIDNNQTAAKEQWGINEARITVKYQVPWPQRFVARKLLLGSAVKQFLFATPYIHRTMPHRWIETTNPDLALYASQVTDTEGLETKGEPACYVTARITVVYSHLPYLLRTDDLMGSPPDESAYDSTRGMFVRFVERNPGQREGRLINAVGGPGKGSGMVFCADGTWINDERPVMNGTPTPYFEETVSFTWHQVPENCVPWDLYSDSLNKINTATFAGRAARTMMFVGMQETFVRLADGGRGWNIALKWKYNRRGWDMLPDPLIPRVGGQLVWHRFVQKGGPSSAIAFELMDMTTLLKPRV